MFHTAKGTPYPMGCTHQENKGKQGFNFSLYSSQAKAVELCLFNSAGKEVRFPMYKTEDVWHIWLANLDYGTEYGFRIYGNSESISNLNKLMLDPYAKAVNGKPDLSNSEKRKWFLLSDDRDNAAFAPKSVITQTDFDWGDDKPLRTPWAETIIYEVHVKGFTQLHLDLPEDIRGSYAGLAHPKMIAYLKELGITAVELLPINYHLDEPHLQEKGLQNYWGYSPLAMFAVESKYWSGREGTTPLTEFKSMVKALHQAGIEVILDVVFNHSVESEKHFPTFCQRGIDDRAYYWQNEDGEYHNYTGCGNSLNLYHDASRRWVLDCLRYWVEECHVDGFRFDLASTLGREPDFNKQALLFREIEQEPCLKHCKLIAEPWDIGNNGYQVGNFPVYFAEWNDRFRDDVTKFWLWKSGELGVFTERFAGSSDIYKHDGRLPHHSINFITAHDGFTLRDLVSYNHKHNEANGENNRDGRNENYSYNHGFEGIENAPPMVEQDRILSRASLMMSLLLANGTPMLLAGDEFGHTQFGNNNAYCQDNETSWLKWSNFDVLYFQLAKQTIALRKKIKSLNKDQWWSIENVQLFNTQGDLMNLEDWHNRDTKAMQILLDHQYLLLINVKTELQTFILPKGRWKIVEDAAFNKNQRWENGFLTLENVDFCVLQK